MIRNNKSPKVKLDQQREIIINYRNAIYQGQYNRLKSKRQGRGIIYLPSTHHFIACTCFNEDKIWGESIFFHSHSKFHYGAWRNNMPQGVCVFKIGQILIITQFTQGKIINRTNILFILQKSCSGLIVEIIDDDKWQIRSKHNAYSSQQLQDLLHQCNFKGESKIHTSLVKFLNGQFNPKDSSQAFKLRLIGNKFYRFGYKNGIAIFFDDQYRVITVGQHKRDELVGLGAKFTFQEKENRIEQGIFDDHNTYFYEPSKKPVDRIQQIYTRTLLSGVQFKNAFFLDPSEHYFDFFTKIINDPEFQSVISQISLQFESKQDFYKSKPKFQYPDLDKYQKIDQNQLSVPSLTKNNKNNSLNQRSREYNDAEKLASSKGKIYERSHSDRHNSFEQLQEKNRLQIIKKQMHQYLTPKKYPSRQPSALRQPQHSDMFGIKFDKNNKDKQDISPVFEYIPDKTPSKISKKEFDYTGNLQQKIDILINGQTPELQKKKKKIFCQDKSIKKDYSPEGQPSPFKSRMRARIFDLQASKTPSKSKSRSRKKIYSKQVTSSRLTQKQKKNHEYLSPHQQLGISLDKSSNQSRIASYPVTMQKGAPRQNAIPGEDIEDQDSSNMKLIKISNYGKHKENRERDDQLSNFKKNNQIYRNPMIKGTYNEYVYEPINIVPANNSPYLKNPSMKSLTNNQSKGQLLDNNISSKKVIGETSPLKKHKMGRYLNQDEVKQPGQIYSDYKKRSFYF